MAITRKSRIRDAWRSPVGHDLLQALMRQIGRDVNWPAGRVASTLPLHVLDRLAGKGFADMLVEQVNSNTETQVAQPAAELHIWWKETVIYQIYLPSFMDSDHDGMGDLGGVIQRLPYLEKLGVQTLWLWPLLDSPSVGERGIRDFCSIIEDLGDMEQLEELIHTLHARGMKLVIGMDIASTSDQHEWFVQALQQPGEKYKNYYVFRTGTPESPPNNWGRVSAGPVWNWYPELGAWGLRLQGRHRMDLNWDNPAVREELQNVVRFWVDKGVDGFCFSSVGHISKKSFEEGSPVVASLSGARGCEQYLFGPQMHHYLRELRQNALCGTQALAIGEVRGAGTEITKLLSAAERGEMDMVLDIGQLLYTPRPSAKKRKRGAEADFSLQALRDHYLNWMEKVAGDHWTPLFLESPELPRMISRIGASPVYRGILAKMLATLLFTLRGTPILYQGQELGLANTRFGSIEELHSAAAQRMYDDLCQRQGPQAAFQNVLVHAPDHARTPMPWSAGPCGGFTGAQPWMRMPDGVEHLNVTVQMEDPNSVWSYYRRLIALRKQAQCLVYGSFKPVFIKNKDVFCYFRIYEGEKWYVELNLSEREIKRPGRILPTQHLALSNYETQARTLRPYEASLYRCD